MAESRSWKVSLSAASLWLFGCSIIGIITAAVSGEHGSIIFALLGLLIGLSGGVANAVLLLWPAFRGLSSVQRNLAAWVAGMGIFILAGAIISWPPTDLLFIAAYVAVPMLFATVLVNVVLGRRNSAQAGH